MIGFRTTDVQIDGPLLKERIHGAGTQFLRVLGYETMRAGQASIKPGSAPSRPGQPPRDKTGVLRRFIRYHVDARQGLLVVGPQHLPRKSQDAPKALERGGVSVSATGDRLRIAARPFMRPAFAVTTRRVLPRLAGSVTAQITQGGV